MSDVPEHFRPPIILGRKPLKNKTVTGIVALTSWIVLFYLLAPLLTIFGWWFGIHRFQVYVIDTPILGETRIMIRFALVVCMIAIVFLGWSLYNQTRFRGRERRRRSRDVLPAETAAAFSASPIAASMLGHAQIARVELDRDGRIGSVFGIDVPGTVRR